MTKPTTEETFEKLGTVLRRLLPGLAAQRDRIGPGPALRPLLIEQPGCPTTGAQGEEVPDALGRVKSAPGDAVDRSGERAAPRHEADGVQPDRIRTASAGKGAVSPAVTPALTFESGSEGIGQLPPDGIQGPRSAQPSVGHGSCGQFETARVWTRPADSTSDAAIARGPTLGCRPIHHWPAPKCASTFA